MLSRDYNNDDILDSNTIFWSKDCHLTWENFLAKPDYNKKPTAESGVGIDDPKYDLELITTKKRTKFRFSNFTVRSCFFPSRSWVKPDQISEKDRDIVVNHEQGHFDISEIFARKAETSLTRYLNEKSFSIKGRDNEELKENANKLANTMVNKIMDEIGREWDQTQIKYDEETKHGTILEVQKQYDEKFSKLRK